MLPEKIISKMHKKFYNYYICDKKKSDLYLFYHEDYDTTLVFLNLTRKQQLNPDVDELFITKPLDDYLEVLGIDNAVVRFIFEDLKGNLFLNVDWHKIDGAVEYLQDCRNVQEIQFYYISSEDSVSEEILDIANRFDKVSVFQYGNNYRSKVSEDAIIPSVQSFNTCQDVSEQEKTYTDYEPVNIGVYNWWIDLRNHIAKLSSKDNTLLMFDEEIYNYLPMDDIEQLKKVNGIDIAVSRKELKSVMKKRAEENRMGFNNCILVSYFASAIFKNKIFLDVIDNIKNFGITNGLDMICVRYDIMSFAHSLYKYEDNKTEVDIMSDRFKKCAQNPNIRFHIPDAFRKDYEVTPELQLPTKDSDFDYHDYIVGNTYLYPTVLNENLHTNP